MATEILKIWSAEDGKGTDKSWRKGRAIIPHLKKPGKQIKVDVIRMQGLTI